MTNISDGKTSTQRQQNIMAKIMKQYNLDDKVITANNDIENQSRIAKISDGEASA